MDGRVAFAVATGEIARMAPHSIQGFGRLLDMVDRKTMTASVGFLSVIPARHFISRLRSQLEHI